MWHVILISRYDMDGNYCYDDDTYYDPDDYFHAADGTILKNPDGTKYTGPQPGDSKKPADKPDKSGPDLDDIKAKHDEKIRLLELEHEKALLATEKEKLVKDRDLQVLIFSLIT